MWDQHNVLAVCYISLSLCYSSCLKLWNWRIPFFWVQNQLNPRLFMKCLIPISKAVAFQLNRRNSKSNLSQNFQSRENGPFRSISDTALDDVLATIRYVLTGAPCTQGCALRCEKESWNENYINSKNTKVFQNHNEHSHFSNYRWLFIILSS